MYIWMPPAPSEWYGGGSSSAGIWPPLPAPTGSLRDFPRRLLLVEPPRHVHMDAPRAVGVVRREILERGDLAADAGAHGVHQVLPDQPAPVAEPVGELPAPGVEEDPRGLAGARREDHDPGRGVLVGAGQLVDVLDPGG